MTEVLPGSDLLAAPLSARAKNRARRAWVGAAKRLFGLK